MSVLTLFLMGIADFLFSCSEDGEVEYVAVEGISLSEWKMEMHSIGEQFKIVPIITPENATNKKVSFFPFKESIVSVDANGLATVVGEGSTVIQVETEDGGKRAFLLVDVKLKEISQDTEMTMYYDETKQFVSSFLPAGCPITISNLKKCGYDNLEETKVEEIVNISNDGYIKAKIPGMVSFVAKANDMTKLYSENVILKVLPRPITRESARMMLIGKGYDNAWSHFFLSSNHWSYSWHNGLNYISYYGNTWDVSDKNGDGDYSSGTVVCIRADNGGIHTENYRNLTPQTIIW